MHAALRRQGYTVEVHPETNDGDNKPDFLAKNAEGWPVAYVEVTTFGPARELIGKQKRAADVWNGIDQTKVPPVCRLGLDIRKHGARTPSLKTLRRKIEAWIRDAGEIDPNDPPAKLFELDDWKIEIVLFGGFREDVVPTHAIATVMGEGRIVSAEMEIREALSDKGKRYGALNAPYVVAVVDCKEELPGGDLNGIALVDAAFGSVVTQTRTFEDGRHETQDVRLCDGYWGAPDAPKHRNVSGVVLLPKAPSLGLAPGAVAAVPPAKPLGRATTPRRAAIAARLCCSRRRNDHADSGHPTGRRSSITKRMAAGSIDRGAALLGSTRTPLVKSRRCREAARVSGLHLQCP
jgi:hypothetical protein